ncbi:MAG: hypothetical protein QW625_02865 [Candidatus Nanoarchaeia archaeon]
MPRMSLEIVIVAVVILIVALVIIGVFMGGTLKIVDIINPTTDQQAKINLCQTACAQYCMLHPDKTSIGWGEEGIKNLIPEYKGEKIDCNAVIGGSCECKKQ